MPRPRPRLGQGPESSNRVESRAWLIQFAWGSGTCDTGGGADTWANELPPSAGKSCKKQSNIFRGKLHGGFSNHFFSHISQNLKSVMLHEPVFQTFGSHPALNESCFWFICATDPHLSVVESRFSRPVLGLSGKVLFRQLLKTQDRSCWAKRTDDTLIRLHSNCHTSKSQKSFP